MDAKRPIPLSVCRRLRVNYDTLADMYKAQSTSISAKVKSAEVRAVKSQVAKLGRCEREKSAIYQVRCDKILNSNFCKVKILFRNTIRMFEKLQCRVIKTAKFHSNKATKLLASPDK